MKNKLMSLILKARVILFLPIFLLACQGCDEPTVRPGADFDGSVKWALQKAQPEITNFSGDAQIYNILGSLIWKDGRLPANTGTWSFVSWSQSLKKTCQVTVDHQGDITKSVHDEVNPPSTGSGTPLPAGWVNSTMIFSAIPGLEITKRFAQLVVFNTTSYPLAPNMAVWVINYAGGKNPTVRWDGQYIGTQFSQTPPAERVA